MDSVLNEKLSHLSDCKMGKQLSMHNLILKEIKKKIISYYAGAL